MGLAVGHAKGDRMISKIARNSDSKGFSRFVGQQGAIVIIENCCNFR
ncbi:hypothetical protein [Moorena sp. SIO3H5]|nr:hypothetical protein [Moorena sp. SIO3H5]NEO72240.1 hypothetical protein [Moorena sp. SIO3H5]